MTERYTAEIEQAIQLFANAILAREEGLKERSLDVDGTVLVLLRRVGLATMSRVLEGLGRQVTEEAAATGLVVQHRHMIEVASSRSFRGALRMVRRQDDGVARRREASRAGRAVRPGTAR